MQKRIGLVGLGKHMNSRLFPALLEAKLGHSKFAYDIDLGKQAAFSRSFRVDEMNGPLSENARRIDALITALPPTESGEALEVCASEDVPLYLEKPGLRSVADYEAAISSLGNACHRVSLGFNFRFAPAILAVRNYLKHLQTEPVFGSIRFISRHPDGPEWGSPTALEAWIRNNGVHAFDLLKFIFGAPTAIHFSGITWVGDRFILFFTFYWPDGGNVRLEFGNATTSFQVSLNLQIGKDKRIAFENLTQCAVTDLDSNLARDLFRQSDESRFSINGYVGSLTEFLGRVRNAESIGANMYDGLEAMKVAEQVLLDARHKFRFLAGSGMRRARNEWRA